MLIIQRDTRNTTIVDTEIIKTLVAVVSKIIKTGIMPRQELRHNNFTKDSHTCTCMWLATNEGQFFS